VTAPQDPYLSPDGHWRWDGTQWVPAAPFYYPPAYYGPPPTGGTDGKAIGSLVCALAAPFVCGLSSIVAVILGHQSRREARRAGREPSGLALAGLIIGYLGVAAAVAFLALVVVGTATSAHCVGDGCGGTARVDVAGPAAVALHDAEAAQERYRTSHGVYAGSAADLAGAGYTDPDGVSVRVLWVQSEFYCLRGDAGDSTLYLEGGDGADSVATTAPCG
jgi:hypothetical protein